MWGLAPDRVLQSVEIVVAQHNKLVGEYAVSDVSQKVTRIIMSYTDYINRIVWRKSL